MIDSLNTSVSLTVRCPRNRVNSKYHVWERTYGEFIRTFTLPKTIEAAKIVAEMKDGVLTIHLPKTAAPKAKGQKIEILAK